MANKLTKRKHNKLLTSRNNYFAFGDFLFKPGEDGKVTNRSFGNLSAMGEGLVKAAGTTVGQIGGNLIGGGLESGAGKVFSSLSSVASAIPGPWGAVASAGLGLLGGVTNKLFGSKLNEENIAQVKSNINNLKSFTVNASDFDALSQSWANAPGAMSFSDDFIGEDGVFSSKAKNMAAGLRSQIASGVDWTQRSLANNADNIAATQMQNLLADYKAYGGPLFAEGGGIHIKPSKRGTFTAAAKKHNMGVQEFASKVLSNKDDYSTAMIKKANFARNASKWKHAFGGDLMTNGATFDTGLTLIGNGGSHEENPNEGVQMGVDEQGTPNLVEEGEAIFNDYVFSKRLKVPKSVRTRYKLKGTKPLTFADAAIQMSKESEERPNDPISQAGLEDSMMKLMIAQEEVREKTGKNKFAKGGHLYEDGSFLWGGNTLNSYGYDSNYNAGNWMIDGAYSEDYYNRIKNMTLADWNQHLQDQREFFANEANRGSARWNVIDYMYKANPWMKNYVATEADIDSMVNLAKSKPGFMHPIEVLQRQLDAEKTPRNKERRMWLTGRTDASGTPLDDILIPDYDPNTGTYQYVKTGSSSGENVDYTDIYYKERPVIASESDEEKKDDEDGEYPDFDDPLRYVGALGPLVGLGMTAFSKPDYSEAEAILEASKSGTYTPVRYKPIGNYLTHRPLDRNYYLNRLNEQAGATRRSVLNTSGQNRGTAMAGLLAADYNALNSVGDMLMKQDMYNREDEIKTEEFNRGTNIQNSQGFLQADMANQQALMNAKDMYLKGTMAAADVRSRQKLAREQAIAGNLSNLFTSIGDIGKERVDRKWRAWSGKQGVYASVQKEKAANGGKIKRKKRGLTF